MPGGGGMTGCKCPGTHISLPLFLLCIGGNCPGGYVA